MVSDGTGVAHVSTATVTDQIVTNENATSHLSSTANDFLPNMNGAAALASIAATATPAVAEETVPVISAAAATDDVRETVSQLHHEAVKELLSTGVCARCIVRLFGIRDEKLYTCLLISESHLCSLIGDGKEPRIVREDEVSETLECCSICLGILQFTYRDDKGKLVKMDSVNEFAVSVAESVKLEGHQFDSFSLEVSLPSIVMENEHLALLYMKGKYGSEPWIQEKQLSGRVSAKKAFNFSVVNALEKLLNVKSTPSSSFRIRLTYTHNKESKLVQNVVKNAHDYKRRRKGEDSNNDVNLTDLSTSEADAVIERSFKQLETHEVIEWFKFPPEANEACRFTVLCYRTPIYFGGRYLKYSRNVSQTRWIIDDERMGEASVEEIIGNSILPSCQGDNYKFHAAGREDIDVRMLGSGRPFLVEIQNARQIPSPIFIKEVEAKINQSENKLVRVKNLKELGSQGWDLMREGEAEKQKQYAALVWISRPLEDTDIQKLSELNEMPILQKTPVRVLHRRSPLERERIIHWMKIERLTESSQYFLLHLCTQAGTYIKEFVHGDLGRTHPSIGSILDCRSEILQLDVTDVKMDCFLTE